MNETQVEPMSIGKVISPFPFHPGGDYNPLFIHHLRMHVVNALRNIPGEPYYGPLYHVSTSDNQPLNIFTIYTDPEFDITEKAVSNRRIILLSANQEGKIAGFKSIILDYLYKPGGVDLSTRGAIETAFPGNKSMIPIELVAQDMLKRMSAKEGEPVQYMIYNGNKEDLDRLKETAQKTHEQTKREIISNDIKSVNDQQERWISAYTRMGFRSTEEYRMRLELPVPSDTRYFDDPLEISDIYLEREGDGVIRPISPRIISQNVGLRDEVQARRSAEYLSSIRPQLNQLCNPEV